METSELTQYLNFLPQAGIKLQWHNKKRPEELLEVEELRVIPGGIRLYCNSNILLLPPEKRPRGSEMIFNYDIRNKVVEEGRLLHGGNYAEVIKLSPYGRGWNLQMIVQYPKDKFHSYTTLPDLNIGSNLRKLLSEEGITFFKDKLSKLYLPVIP